jgi:hypothetical protein
MNPLLSHLKTVIGCIKDYCDGQEAMVWVIWWLDAMQIKPKQTLDGLSQLYSTDHS